MKKATVLFFILAGCGKPYNSSTSDSLKYGSAVAGSANFQVARLVMLNSCFKCHGDWSQWTEADFVANSKVVARNLANSTLYTRIRGNDIGTAGDMPQDGSLSSEDISAIKTWILGM